MTGDLSPEPEHAVPSTQVRRWTGRRIVVAAIGLLLIALLVPVVVTGSWPFVVYLGIGIMLAAVYTFHGAIPERLRRLTIRFGSFEENVWSINEPDDPSNLSYKVVAPILLVVVGGGVLAVVGLILGWW